jgi:PPK2 family polyphosphate:nucleotide phosphotransferase
MKIEDYQFNSEKNLHIKDYPTEIESELDKFQAVEQLALHVKELAKLQDMLYAQDKRGVLVIIQAMDTAGKDGIIRHVISGLNPQGTQVHPFKQPTQVELDHTWLWKAQTLAPEKGNIAVFNRSYYEEVLIVKLHNLVKNQKIPVDRLSDKIWDERYKDIRHFEDYLQRNGIDVIKIFLHISKDEQKERLLARIDDKEKNWKFDGADLKERGHWVDYMDAYEEMINKTSTDESPWYVIPSDKKKLSRLAVAKILIDRLKKLDLKYPELNKQQTEKLQEYKKMLMEE